jgi:hypothetical protein
MNIDLTKIAEELIKYDGDDPSYAILDILNDLYDFEDNLYNIMETV